MKTVLPCKSGDFRVLNFRAKSFCIKYIFCSPTPLQNYSYIFLTKKELVHASSIRSTTPEEYQHQSKQARSRLPHIYERELTTLQCHSKCTNISYCNYFAGLIIHCKKYFAVSIICSEKFFSKIYFRSFERLR